MKLPKGVRAEGVTIEFSQPSDDMDEEQLGQDITVQSVDIGGGPYYVITTKRWAFDSIEDLAALVEVVKGMVAEEADHEQRDM